MPFLPPPTSSTHAATFDDRARGLTSRLGQWMGLFTGTAALLWWPLDPVLYAGEPETIAAFGLWRPITAISMFLGAGLLRWVVRTRTATHVIFVGVLLFVVVVTGLTIAPASGVDQRFIFAHYLMPFSTIALITRLPARIAVTALVSATSFALFVLNPGFTAFDHRGTIVAFSAVTFLLSIVLGQATHTLVRANFEQGVLLDERARRLEELDRLKNDFFANVSHELRTPLTLILASFAEMRGEKLTDVLRSRLALGERNAARLLEMIDELLELARFESGRAEPRPYAMDVAELVRDVAGNFRPSSPEEGEVLVVGCDEPVWIEADARLLRTAIHNLASNAYKFTEPSTRRVELALSEGAGAVHIAVRDNGPGIPESALPRLFERFFRSEAADGQRRRGTGIGLALVREIALSHGGDVAVQSEPGSGSSFTLTLPVGAGRAAASSAVESDAAAPSSSALARLARAPVPAGDAVRSEAASDAPTLVVAEDDPELGAYLERLLAARYRVVRATDGDEAVAAVRRERPLLLVTDVTMPYRSGIAVADELRSDERFARLPILFLTAHIGMSARAEAYAAGGNDFLTKPFHPEELLARVENLLALRETERRLATMNDALEARVTERTTQLRELSRHLERSREDERRRIARDLHDETGQLLMALRMDLDHARKSASGGELAVILERMDDVLDQAFSATRELVGELRPRILDDLGLAPAVEWYLQRFDERSEVRCRWSIEPSEVDASSDVATAVYRILQESLTNVVRHSGAANLEVRLRLASDRIELEIMDDGGGFATSESVGGFGLLGMQERARSFDGRLSVESALGEGTSVRLSIPSGVEVAA